MPDNDCDRRDNTDSPRTGGGLLFAMLLLSPVFYILSIGPVAWFSEHGYLPVSSDTIRAIYYPVIWLHDHTPLEKPLEWYIMLFGVR